MQARLVFSFLCVFERIIAITSGAEVTAQVKHFSFSLRASEFLTFLKDKLKRIRTSIKL